MGLIPTFRLAADTTDVTAAIAERFVSLRLTDEAGMASDVLEVTLADDLDEPIPMPRTGAELELWLGYDDDAQRMGLFVCDEVELEGWPARMTIRARAAPYATSKGGKKTLATQKSRSWAANTKLADMAAKIAKENGLEPAVSPSLKSVTLPHYDQTEESDLSFLVRIARRYDAVVKPAGGKLMVAKRGEGKTASGEDLPPLTITPDQCSAYRLTLARRDSPGTVLAYWHDKRAAKRKEVKAGTGEPTKSLRQWFRTEAAANQAAKAELDRRKRGEQTVSVTLVGDPTLMAEAPLTLEGFRPDVDGEWLVTRVTHNLTKSGGYSCDVEAEQPNE